MKRSTETKECTMYIGKGLKDLQRSKINRWNDFNAFWPVLENEQTMALGIINFQLIIFYLKKKRQSATKRIQSKWCTFQFSFD